MKKPVTMVLAGLTLVIGLEMTIAQENSMSFFLTSNGPGNGADLGGLAGADAHCAALADAAGAGSRNWKAYLSTDSINARDRIGNGPWHNAEGTLIAANVDQLHSDSANVNKETALDENGAVVNGSGDTPNRHDILTGSHADGTAFDDGEDHTCSLWSSSSDGSAHLGHHDRLSRGKPGSPWNDAHPSRGCSQDNLRSTGGDGLFYCFAAD
ncbi:MAG: lectin [Gammaproteobacteria bacterium]|nr:MAG: lectin [Gammaproteobacteria bacterium]